MVYAEQIVWGEIVKTPFEPEEYVMDMSIGLDGKPRVPHKELDPESVKYMQEAATVALEEIREKEPFFPRFNDQRFYAKSTLADGTELHIIANPRAVQKGTRVS